MRFGNNHQVCGCYFVFDHKHTYLPQVQLTSHTTITPVSFTTRLTQVFRNPHPNDIPQLRYAFPLYDGVAVGGYSISYGDTTLRGVVKQSDDAKKTFQAAVDRGETAGLLDALPAGVFGVTLGHVPAATDIVVQIDYAGELKHDAAVDGLRYMLPTSIAPRYGSYPGEVLPADSVNTDGMRIVVDIDMGKANIRRVQSPGHPIAVSMGGLSTAERGAAFVPSQASATLTQGSAELAGDFVLQLLVDDIGKPHAILEVHPTIPDQRTIMATLVPKFVLEAAHPEIVFLADQSGSMSGSKNTALVAALKIFLKSLPIGVRFNVAGFGSDFKFLWPSSQAYSEANVNSAMEFVESFTASYGGTEILEPIRSVFERRLKDMPLEVMLLTDGEIWAEHDLFSYINEQLRDRAVDARVFALGIGTDVSHTLVEGVARAGNGFAQFVTQNEDTDQKVIRMLKGAIYAHTKDYELEVHYTDEDATSKDEEFEIVERINECLVIDTGPAIEPKQAAPTKSFFDASAEVDKAIEKDGDRYAHLPAIDTPKLIQAPAHIPPLFPFNRTTVHVLLGPGSVQKKPVSVTLRATSAEGPLELNIPISVTQSGSNIHQLAARRAIQDLEEGRGWLQAATVRDAAGQTVTVKEKHQSRFDEIVEREGVRLGERFQVASKWTSFVAVQDNSKEQEIELPQGNSVAGRMQASPAVGFGQAAAAAPRNAYGGRGLFTSAPSARPRLLHHQVGATAMIPPGTALFGSASSGPSGGGLFGSASPTYNQASQPLHQTTLAAGHHPVAYGSAQPMAFGSSALFSTGSTALASASAAPAAQFLAAKDDEDDEDEEDGDMGFALMDDDSANAESNASAAAAPAALPPPPARERQARVSTGGVAPRKQLASRAARRSAPSDQPVPSPPPAPPSPASSSSSSTLHRLISLQTFSGAWGLSDELLTLLGLVAAQVDVDRFDRFVGGARGGARGEGGGGGGGGERSGDRDVAATALAIAFCEAKLREKRDVWELVVGKARAWLARRVGGDNGGERVDEMVEVAKTLL